MFYPASNMSGTLHLVGLTHIWVHLNMGDITLSVHSMEPTIIKSVSTNSWGNRSRSYTFTWVDR
jgi:hypothetical protein